MKHICSAAVLAAFATGAAAEIIVDNCGEPLTFDATPERIVVHDMNMTEMAFALGLQDKIVGLTGITGWYKTSEDFDELRGDIPALAPKYPTVENLVGASPDLFFAGWYYGMKPGGEVTPDTLAEFPGVGADTLGQGEVVRVNFWAAWCPPCRAEHPKLLEMQAEGMPIIGVNIRDQEANAAKYLQDDGNPFLAVPFDPAGRTSIDWGVTAPPETFIVDGDGTVLYRFIGPLVGSDYEQRFLPELTKAMQ